MSTATVEVHRDVVRDGRPLVLHVVHRFATGGLENGVVNLINAMSESAYRHVVLALTEVTEFRHRITRDDVGYVSLHKTPGHGVGVYSALLGVLRDLRPDVMHTRNLGPLEMQPVAAFAGVSARIHGEHGRELSDLDGSNRRLQLTRRLYAPFVHRYVALSRDLEAYLTGRVGIAQRRVVQIYNGVDGERFRPAQGQPAGIRHAPFVPGMHWLVGTVGRLQGVKHQALLARAFVRALQLAPDMHERARLVVVGEGPLRAQCIDLLQEAGLAGLAWLPGERADVPDVMRGLSCFVLPSLAEGISNTILEAMACGLPVVATAVGGNGELVIDGQTGCLVPSDDVDAMASAMVQLYRDRTRAFAMGMAGRALVDQKYSLHAMVAAYQDVYDTQLAAVGRAVVQQRH